MSNAMPMQPVPVPRNGFGITALVLALCGLVFGLMPITAFIAVICGALAILFGLLGHARYRRHEATNGKMCISGAVLGVVTLALGIWGVVLFFTAVDDFTKEVEKIDEGFNSSFSDTPSDTQAAETVEVEEPVYHPTAEDYTMELKTISKQCFGSAGCNLIVEPSFTYMADIEVPDMACDITYEISGDESGPIIETFTSYGEEGFVMQSSMTTASGEVEPSGKVTEVTCY